MSDELAAILDEMVVFSFEDGTYASNSPYWNDSRIRKAWVKRHGKKTEETSVEPESPSEPDEVEEVEDYSSLTNEELRTELAGRGLSVNGNKTEMVARLEENDAAEE
jgi:hypothetical protein